jgi:hypothetical protein
MSDATATLQQRHPMWTITVGRFTGDYIATHPSVPSLVIAHTAQSLEQAISEWETWLGGVRT